MEFIQHKKLSKKKHFIYRGWYVQQTQIFDEPIIWVATRGWQHQALGAHRSVITGSFVHVANIRPYVIMMNQVLGGFEI